MRVLLVIPARFASVRFPGKALAPLRGAGGKARPLIRRSWDAARRVRGIERVVVATDDTRIADCVRGFGADVAMTSPDCANGTERCAEALQVLGGGFDVVVNLQGDAPLTPPWFVEALIAALAADPEADMATPVLRCSARALADLREDRRAGRVGATTAVFDARGRALYFSREVLPHQRADASASAPAVVHHHVGVYAYRPAALLAYRDWAPGPLECAEGLEQLRFLEQGRRVLCIEVDAGGRDFWEVNNPQDVARVEAMLRRAGME